jgi:hypothetical protein
MAARADIDAIQRVRASVKENPLVSTVISDEQRLWLTTEPGTRAQRFYTAAGWELMGTTTGGELRYELKRPFGP